MAPDKTLNHAREATRVTLVGMWLDIALGIGKIAGGLLGNSFALVTDGIHSLTDALSDVFVIIMARIGQTPPDEEHPWGHGRFETVGTIAMGVLFFTTAGILIFDSVQKLIEPNTLEIPAVSTIAIAMISVVSKEWIFHYTMNVANKLNSSLLKANAWHSRSDAFSSIAVVVGITGALLGYPWMDTLAAIVVALIIAKIGWELCADALRELVDTQVPKQRREQIEIEIVNVAGITGINNLRSRSSGGKVILELSLHVDPNISVCEGHGIGEKVSKTLTGQFSDIADVIVHIDPVTALPTLTSTILPTRGKMLALLKERWQELLTDKEIESVDLHYSAHGIGVNLIIKADIIAAPLAEELRQSISSLECITSLKIFTKAFESKPSH